MTNLARVDRSGKQPERCESFWLLIARRTVYSRNRDLGSFCKANTFSSYFYSTPFSGSPGVSARNSVEFRRKSWRLPLRGFVSRLMSSAKANPVSLVGERIGQPAQITSLFMIEVIISADGGVPRGRKNMTKHDNNRDWDGKAL